MPGQDHARLTALGRELADIEAAVAETEDEWLMLAEEAGS